MKLQDPPFQKGRGPRPGRKNAAQRGHEESGQALLAFPTQPISIKSDPFCPIMSLHGYVGFYGDYAMKSPEKPKRAESK